MNRPRTRLESVSAAPGASPSKSESRHEGDLHRHAMAAASSLVRRFDGRTMPEDARTVVGYYQSARLAAERAAQSVLLYAATFDRGER